MIKSGVYPVQFIVCVRGSVLSLHLEALTAVK